MRIDDSVDRLNAVGVLTRREIEARILAPIIDALGQRFGRDEVVAIVREVIAGIARDQGRDDGGGPGRRVARRASSRPWVRGRKTMPCACASFRNRRRAFDFDVTRCRYAEMYRALGIPELGEVLSCQRDAALIEGFNPEVTLTRTQTIMQGAACCDFRYRGPTP